MKKFWIGSGLVSVLVATAFTLASCGGSTEAPKSADSGAAPAAAGGPAATPDDGQWRNHHRQGNLRRNRAQDGYPGYFGQPGLRQGARIVAAEV